MLLILLLLKMLIPIIIIVMIHLDPTARQFPTQTSSSLSPRHGSFIIDFTENLVDFTSDELFEDGW